MIQKMPVEELEEMANIEVGEALRRTRIHYGQTLQDIENALRIRSCQIDAIEKGDMNQLPGRVYAIGFVRTYAEYLDLDGGKVVQLFKAQYMDVQPSATLSFPVPASETKTPAIWLITLCLLLSGLFFTGVYKFTKSNDLVILTVQNVPEEIKSHVNQEILVSSSTIENLGPAEPLSSEVAVENMGDEVEQKTGIILNIVDSSWVEIKNGEGEILVSNILESGDQYFVPDSPGLSMSLGNAANVEIILHGRALKPLGGDGDVRRDIPLDSAYLGTLEFKDDVEFQNTEL